MHAYRSDPSARIRASPPALPSRGAKRDFPGTRRISQRTNNPSVRQLCRLAACSHSTETSACRSNRFVPTERENEVLATKRNKCTESIAEPRPASFLLEGKGEIRVTLFRGKRMSRTRARITRAAAFLPFLFRSRDRIRLAINSTAQRETKLKKATMLLYVSHHATGR